MAPERCAELILRAAYHRVAEAWVSKPPELIAAYLGVYSPAVARVVLGPFIRRVEAASRAVERS